MRKVLVSMLALALAVFALAAPAVAQDSYGAIQRLLDGETANANITAVSTHTPLICRYVGPLAAGGTITVAAGGDITFSLGAVGASAVDTTLECPLAAPYGGVFTVANAACDTLGEVINIVNKSPNWRCVLRDGMAADSSNNTLITLAETAANTEAGLALLADTAVTFDVAAELTPERTMRRSLDPGTRNMLAPNPAANSRVALFQATATSTYGADTSTWEVYTCATRYPTRWVPFLTTNTALGYIADENMTESCERIDAQAGGATTVQKLYTYPYALEGRKGDRLIVRLNNLSAMTAPQLTAYARVAPLK